jgi:undecaprenyl phosphate N,N'-diacetylbacillosamine 1-phosphate transferase
MLQTKSRVPFIESDNTLNNNSIDNIGKGVQEFKTSYSLYKAWGKRLFDIIVSIVALTISLPIMIIVACFLWWKQNGQVFFYQERPGKNGEMFSIFKFKTMTDDRDESGKLLPDEMRTTTIGKFIRKCSLDELPQLFNVLKGDMSLVGPRPQLAEYLPLYSPEQARRHEVKPGITGLAQVKGRNLISWERRFKYDVFYVDNLSFYLDLKIMVLTVFKVILSHGVEYQSSVELSKFSGTKSKIIVVTDEANIDKVHVVEDRVRKIA